MVGVQRTVLGGIIGVALFVEGAAYLPCLIDRAVHLVIGLPGTEDGRTVVQPLARDQPPQRIVAVEVGGGVAVLRGNAYWYRVTSTYETVSPEILTIIPRKHL